LVFQKLFLEAVGRIHFQLQYNIVSRLKLAWIKFFSPSSYLNLHLFIRENTFQKACLVIDGLMGTEILHGELKRLWIA